MFEAAASDAREAGTGGGGGREAVQNTEKDWGQWGHGPSSGQRDGPDMARLSWLEEVGG